MLQSWNGKYHQRYTPPFARVSRSCFQISESGNRTARRFRSRFCFFRGRRQASQAARAAAASPDRKISIADPSFYGRELQQRAYAGAVQREQCQYLS